jgi:hypothetical protein
MSFHIMIHWFYFSKKGAERQNKTVPLAWAAVRDVNSLLSVSENRVRGEKFST